MVAIGTHRDGRGLGFEGFWVVLGEVLGVGVAWILMSRRFHRLTMHYEAITIPDYLERRFEDQSQRIRLVAAFALTVFVTIYVSAQIDATGAAFESFLGWELHGRRTDWIWHCLGLHCFRWFWRWPGPMCFKEP